MCISEYVLLLQMYIIFANIHYFTNAHYSSPEITKTPGHHQPLGSRMDCKYTLFSLTAGEISTLISDLSTQTLSRNLSWQSRNM